MSIIFSLLTHAVLIFAVIFALLQVRRWRRYWPLAYGLASVVVIIPLGYWLVLEFSKGYFSDLSLLTLTLLVIYLTGAIRQKRYAYESSLSITVLCLAAFLYPASLGLGMFDPYALGFASHNYYDALVLITALFGILAWYSGMTQLAVYLMLVLLAHGLQVYESTNLWNYLLDPIGVMICFVSLLIDVCKKLYSKMMIKRI